MKTFNSHNKRVKSEGLIVIVIILQKKIKVIEMNKTSRVEAQVKAQPSRPPCARSSLPPNTRLYFLIAVYSADL